MKKAFLIILVFGVALAGIQTTYAGQESSCPTFETMKRGVVLKGETGGVFIRLGDDQHTTEVFLDENLGLRMDQLHTHDHGILLAYERENGVKRFYVPSKPIAELFPLETGKRWDATMTVLEGETVVREDLPISYEVGLQTHLDIGGCNYAVTELIGSTENLKGETISFIHYYSSELKTVLQGQHCNLAGADTVAMKFDELHEIPEVK